MRNLFLSILLGLTFSVNAADTSPAGPAALSWLKEAKQLIVDNKFDQAINLLSQASDKQSADWHNLMDVRMVKISIRANFQENTALTATAASPALCSSTKN